MPRAFFFWPLRPSHAKTAGASTAAVLATAFFTTFFAGAGFLAAFFAVPAFVVVAGFFARVAIDDHSTMRVRCCQGLEALSRRGRETPIATHCTPQAALRGASDRHRPG